MPFDVSELERLANCVATLCRHVPADVVGLTGGVAIELRAASAGLTSGRRTLHDVDFIISDYTRIASTVAADFLIGHYHVPQDRVPRFLLQLVDVASGLRTDIFPDLAGSLERARPVALLRERVLMLDASDMLEHKLKTLAGASTSNLIDEKHYRDAVLLAAICGKSILRVSADVLGRDVYGTDVSGVCDRCARSASAAFPLAPRQAILDVLGYV